MKDKGSDRARCRPCRGTGRILLLTSSAPCDACGGTGRTGAAPEAATEVPSYAYVARYEAPSEDSEPSDGETGRVAMLITNLVFDEHDRLISRTVEERIIDPPQRGTPRDSEGGP